MNVTTLHHAALGLALCAACSTSPGKDEPATKPAPATPAAAPIAPDAAAPPSGSRHPWFDEVGRGGAVCRFVKLDTDFGQRTALFEVTAPPGHGGVTQMWTWQLYYGKDGKLLGKSWTSTIGPSPEPKPLGLRGKELPKDAETIECEITDIDFADKTFWVNANLVPATGDRPMGGVPADVLRGKTGEKVKVDVLDAKTGHVRLTNLSDKPISSVHVDLIYQLTDGTHEINDHSITVALEPGKSAEADVVIWKTLEPAAVLSDATAPHVEFADDSVWDNYNLEGGAIRNRH